MNQKEGKTKRAVRTFTLRNDEKMKLLLEALPEMVGRRFLYDDVGRFSITRGDQALELCGLLATLVYPQTAAICDACACVGGNAIFFDSVFAHTTCIEIDPVRTACLRSNLLSANPQSFVPSLPSPFLLQSSLCTRTRVSLFSLLLHAHTQTSSGDL